MATRTWTGLAGDGIWTTNGNWSGGVAPTGADDVVIAGASTIDMNDGNRSCLSINASAFTGTLTDGGLIVGGPTASFGAGCQVNLGNGLHINNTTTTLTVGAGCVIAWLRVYSAGALVLGSNVYAQEIDPSTSIDVGVYDLSFDDLEIGGGVTTWAWASGGTVTARAGSQVNSGVAQATPSLPPFVIANGMTLNGGDLTVDHIVSQAGVVTLNGNEIIEVHPVVPPVPVVTAVEAQTLSALEAAVNAFLATLTDTDLNYVDIAAFVDDRRIGTDLRAVITTTPGGAALATPFVLKTFFGVSDGDGSCLSIVQAAIQAFLSAHTGYFFAASRLIFIDVVARPSQCIAWLIYNTTAGASANYLPL